MRILLLVVLALSLVACGPSRPAGDAGSPGDAGSSSDAGLSDASVLVDSGGVSLDGSIADGSVLGVDGGPPDPSCVPTPGGASLVASCQQMVLSVLRGDGDPALEVTGYLTGLGDGCLAVDEVELLDGEESVQTLAGGDGMTVTGGSAIAVARSDAAAASIVALCAEDGGRYDTHRIRVRGRVDGGTFTAECGGSEGSWPPGSVVTCHRGLLAGPQFQGGASVEVSTAFTSSSAWALYPSDSGELPFDTLASDVYVVPTAVPFSSAPFQEPRVTTGWSGTVSFNTGARQTVVVQFNQGGDAFGTDLCPAPDGSDPFAELPPVLLVRFSGTGPRGPIESEAYLDSCYRSVSSP